MWHVWKIVGVLRKEREFNGFGPQTEKIKKKHSLSLPLSFPFSLASIYFAIANLHQANHKRKEGPRATVGWAASQSPLWTPVAMKKVESGERKATVGVRAVWGGYSVILWFLSFGIVFLFLYKWMPLDFDKIMLNLYEHF